MAFLQTTSKARTRRFTDLSTEDKVYFLLAGALLVSSGSAIVFGEYIFATAFLVERFGILLARYSPKTVLWGDLLVFGGYILGLAFLVKGIKALL
ncbi:MAG: hypothetical protein JWO43_362 [Candidatus Adlerbacteria bacterium]|nr:hypothetical protein [Candidatus Adlerbacteria bacterium]